MQAQLVLTIMGVDRPGLVEALSGAITTNGGNWLESRMAELAGRFVGILLVSAPESNMEALIRALQRLEREGLQLSIMTEGMQEPPVDYRPITVELTGQDHPGIVHDLAHALAARNINIEELETGCSNASWSGESMFHATANLRVPPSVSIDELREILEALAKDLMVDINADVDQSH